MYVSLLCTSPSSDNHADSLVFQLSDATDSTRPPQVILKNYPHPNAGTHVTSRLVCDASGFARKLTGKFGKKEVFEGWNCDAYWAYFRPKGLGLAENRLSHWDHAATRHIWYVPSSWLFSVDLINYSNVTNLCP